MLDEPTREHDARQHDVALVDPRSKHPAPPFKRQHQPWPGLAGQMEPRPDHGEASYKGSGRLLGRRSNKPGAKRSRFRAICARNSSASK
jgi:hypothetical protein